jgi:hypothetical protein
VFLASCEKFEAAEMVGAGMLFASEYATAASKHEKEAKQLFE